MKKVLVIGGTGTMGQPLVDILQEEGYDVSVVCRTKKAEKEKVCYHYGNAKDKVFMQSLLCEQYDSIIDFCWYTADEFALYYNALLQATSQYICLSSCAVISDGSLPLTEETPRFFDIEGSGGEQKIPYHIQKALIEEILKKSVYRNWTIVRPHITYNSTHLIWGEYCEEEFVLRSALGKRILIPEDMLQYRTSLTYGGDVAKMIFYLVNNKKALGEIVNLTSPYCLTWGEILAIYQEILKKRKIEMKCVYTPNTLSLQKAIPGLKDRYIYDRLLNREFNIDKFERIADVKMSFTDLKHQLSLCVDSYLADVKRNGTKFRYTFACAQHDRLTGDWTQPSNFYSWYDYLDYLAYRIPELGIAFKVILKTKRIAKKIIRK